MFSNEIGGFFLFICQRKSLSSRSRCVWQSSEFTYYVLHRDNCLFSLCLILPQTQQKYISHIIIKPEICVSFYERRFLAFFQQQSVSRFLFRSMSRFACWVPTPHKILFSLFKSSVENDALSLIVTASEWRIYRGGRNIQKYHLPAL